MAELESSPIPQGVFKGALDLLGRLATAKPYAESQALVADLMKKVSSMYGEYEAMAEANAALKTKLAGFENFSRKEKRYTSHTEDSGVVTYKLKKASNPEEEAHRFCPNCFLNSKLSYLQPTHSTVHDSRRRGRFRVHHCNSCKSDFHYQFEHDRPMPTNYSGSGGSIF